jgi:hypothetical protein
MRGSPAISRAPAARLAIYSIAPDSVFNLNESAQHVLSQHVFSKETPQIWHKALRSNGSALYS